MKFSKILVALDFSALDEKLISYSHFITKRFSGNAIQFVHIMPFYIAPNSLDSNLEALIQEGKLLPEKHQKALAEDVQSIFDDIKEVNINLSVKEGKPQAKLLTLLEKGNPDLLVLGKKEVSGGSGILAQRIARRATCAVWFVTEDANTALRNILVPIDFSAHSLRALEAALHLKEHVEGVNITALHLIDVPMTAYKINKNKNEIIRRLKERAERVYQQFLTENQLSAAHFNFKMLLNDAFDVSRYVKETAAAEKSDLIIIGAQGRSGLSGFVFGSVTEKLISTKGIPPVLVVR